VPAGQRDALAAGADDPARKSRLREEISMASAEDTDLRGRERLPVIAILVLVALMALVGGVLAASSGPSSQIPVFVLEKGRFTAFDAAGAAPRTSSASTTGPRSSGGTREAVADEGFRGFLRDRRGRLSRIDFPGAAGTSTFDLNDRGQIVGIYANPDAAPNGQRRPMQMPGMMSGR
jgi:hypothetical protein